MMMLLFAPCAELAQNDQVKSFVSVITGMIALAWISGLLALAGIAFTALGAFAPLLLHLH